MDYIFSDPKEKEILETCGNEYTDLSGWFEITQNDEDVPITDRCYIKYKLGSRKDDSNKYHVWYEITNHARYIDKDYLLNELPQLKIVVATTEERVATIEERVATIEDVLCEIDAGGNIMNRIWANRLEAGTQLWSACPISRRATVDAILRQDVEDGKITATQYEEITGTPYN